MKKENNKFLSPAACCSSFSSLCVFHPDQPLAAAARWTSFSQGVNTKCKEKEVGPPLSLSLLCGHRPAVGCRYRGERSSVCDDTQSVEKEMAESFLLYFLCESRTMLRMHNKCVNFVQSVTNTKKREERSERSFICLFFLCAPDSVKRSTSWWTMSSLEAQKEKRQRIVTVHILSLTLFLYLLMNRPTLCFSVFCVFGRFYQNIKRKWSVTAAIVFGLV
jgi:hypothetical protein